MTWKLGNVPNVSFYYLPMDAILPGSSSRLLDCGPWFARDNSLVWQHFTTFGHYFVPFFSLQISFLILLLSVASVACEASKKSLEWFFKPCSLNRQKQFKILNRYFRPTQSYFWLLFVYSILFYRRHCVLSCFASISLSVCRYPHQSSSVCVSFYLIVSVCFILMLSYF